MQAIYKYPFEIDDEFSLEMPKNAEVLCVQVQRDVPCLWALVIDEPWNGKETRRFCVVGTGNQTDVEGDNYVGTVQTGQFVWHVFEK